MPASTLTSCSTRISERYETDDRSPPPWSMVTDRIPATFPAKVTTPAPEALTELP